MAAVLRAAVQVAVEADLVFLAQAQAAVDPVVLVARAVPSQPPVPAGPEVVVDLVVPAARALLAQRAVPALPEVVVALALAAEEQPEGLLHLRSRPSFSAAMARTTP